MGTKWRDDARRATVRPRFSWSLPVIAALVLLVVASTVHFTLFPLNANAGGVAVSPTLYAKPAPQPGDVIVMIRVRGENCLQAEDSTRLRLVAYRPSDHLAVYRCVTP